MINKFKKVIATTVSVLSISMIPLSGPAAPGLCSPGPVESDSGEEPGGGNGCEPLSDEPEIEYVDV